MCQVINATDIHLLAVASLLCSIRIFKSHVSPDKIQSHISDVEGKGGKVKQRFDSDIMKGFAASMPDEHGQSLMAASKGGTHEEM